MLLQLHVPLSETAATEEDLLFTLHQAAMCTCCLMQLLTSQAANTSISSALASVRNKIVTQCRRLYHHATACLTGG